MTTKEAIEMLQHVRITSFRPNGTARVKEALDMAISALSVIDIVDLTNGNTITKAEYDEEPSKSRPYEDCAKCIHKYGTLGCCSTVNNEWVYDCDNGMAQYEITKAESSDDLISRANATEELGEYFDYLKRIDKRGIKRIEPISRDCKGIINKLPSADKPSGEWLEIEDYNGDYHYQCSVCKDEFYIEYGTPKENGYEYCPSCGARMYKGGDSK